MGVDIRTATPVDDLILKEGAVVGVTAHNKTTRYEVSAKAVVLATGGFAHDKEMLAKFVPQYAAFADLSVATVGATGDGIRMAVKAGGVKVNDKFQVVRADGSPVKGLYAGGEVQNRPYYNRVYTSGTGLGIAYTSGRIAGGYAAEEK